MERDLLGREAAGDLHKRDVDETVVHPEAPRLYATLPDRLLDALHKTNLSDRGKSALDDELRLVSMWTGTGTR